LYVEGFKYGDCLLQHGAKHSKQCRESSEELACSQSPPITKPSGDTEGGYVVYHQTEELVNALDRIDDVDLF